MKLGSVSNAFRFFRDIKSRERGGRGGDILSLL